MTPTLGLRPGSTVFYYPIPGTVEGAMRARVVEVIDDESLKIAVIVQTHGRATEETLTVFHANHPRHAGAWDHVA